MALRFERLRDRSAMLQKARNFFLERGLLEVDCPLLSLKASVDAHIDLIPAHTSDGIGYLHSSPEYWMKRLLAEGIGDIFQLSHVFRQGEVGAKHNPEFTLAEWYRVGFSFEEMIEETLAFIRLFLGEQEKELISYRQAFLNWVNIDPFKASDKELLDQCTAYDGIEREGRDAVLNLILAEQIEPNLGKGRLTVLYGYPATQAALAKTRWQEGQLVAERFEVYYQEVELANGYHELIDPVEQRKRLESANQHRLELGKESLPIDERFLEALEEGVPDSCGVAVGFDRLMMLRHNLSSLKPILPFSWPLA